MRVACRACAARTPCQAAAVAVLRWVLWVACRMVWAMARAARVVCAVAARSGVGVGVRVGVVVAVAVNGCGKTSGGSTTGFGAGALHAAMARRANRVKGNHERDNIGHLTRKTQRKAHTVPAAVEIGVGQQGKVFPEQGLFEARVIYPRLKGNVAHLAQPAGWVGDTLVAFGYKQEHVEEFGLLAVQAGDDLGLTQPAQFADSVQRLNGKINNSIGARGRSMLRPRRGTSVRRARRCC